MAGDEDWPRGQLVGGLGSLVELLDQDLGDKAWHAIGDKVIGCSSGCTAVGDHAGCLGQSSAMFSRQTRRPGINGGI